MPVGGPRRYSGGEGSLGRLAEWLCPTCGATVTGPYEGGCPQCGVGKPGGQGEQPQGAADQKLLDRTGKKPVRPLINPPAWQEDPADRPDYLAPVDPRVRPAAARGGRPQPDDTTVYRVVAYTPNPDGQAGLEETLRRGLVGKFDFIWGSIVATLVDSVDARQMDLLGLAKRQPGVWLGGPRDDQARWKAEVDATLPMNRLVALHGLSRAATDPHLREYATEELNRMSNVPPPPAPPQPPPAREDPAATYVPDQGPAFSVLEAQLAKLIVSQAGLRTAYTLALALQNYAELSDMETMEPGKVLDSSGCLSLANAIMQLIPAEWNPEPEPVEETDGPQF